MLIGLLISCWAMILHHVYMHQGQGPLLNPTLRPIHESNNVVREHFNFTSLVYAGEALWLAGCENASHSQLTQLPCPWSRGCLQQTWMHCIRTP